MHTRTDLNFDRGMTKRGVNGWRRGRVVSCVFDHPSFLPPRHFSALTMSCRIRVVVDGGGKEEESRHPALWAFMGSARVDWQWQLLVTR